MRFTLDIHGVRIDGIQDDDALMDVCDMQHTPLEFGCRAGACGKCLVEVTEGVENLSGLTDIEQIMLPELTSNARARLGCQVRLHGNATFRCLEI